MVIHHCGVLRLFCSYVLYTNVCLCAGSGRLLETEQKAFRMATVEPVHQLKEDLLFRQGEVQHQRLAGHRSSWEQVMRQVHEAETRLHVHI